MSTSRKAPAALADTVILSQPPSPSSLQSPSSLSGHHPALEIVQGSRADLSQEIQELLRHRLRTVAILLFAALSAFLWLRWLSPPPRETLAGPILLPLHLAATMVMGLLAWRLCTSCRVVHLHLRSVEFLIFGSGAVLLWTNSYVQLQIQAAAGHAASLAGPWMLLIFTYALFVPNTWQRSLLFIIPMALLPLAALFVGQWSSSDVAAVLASPDYPYWCAELSLTMVLTATIAVWGVRTIRSLRSEAFQARQLGQYRLRRLIGSGGMGDVYVAEHLLLKRPCAIKLIHADRAGDPQALARFEREVRATARLSHWNTVEIYDYGRTDDGTFYYVMEYLLGMNLNDLVAQYGPLPPGRVVYLLRQTCEALAEAHEIGLVHRDIKPANIFAAKRGRAYDVAKLLDFGLVRQLTAAESTMVTAENSITGSPLFMSPEQAVGEETDTRGDIYSLGAVAYYLLTGEPPFKAERPIQVIVAHANQIPRPLSEWNAGVPADLEAVVLRCLEKRPDDRYATVDDLSRALDRCSCRGSWGAQQAAEWWRNHGCPRKRELDAAVLRGESLTSDSAAPHQAVEAFG